MESTVVDDYIEKRLFHVPSTVQFGNRHPLSPSLLVPTCISSELQDAEVSQIQVQVCIFAFDLLYLNGEVRTYVCMYYVLCGWV